MALEDNLGARAMNRSRWKPMGAWWAPKANPSWHVNCIHIFPGFRIHNIKGVVSEGVFFADSNGVHFYDVATFHREFQKTKGPSPREMEETEWP